MANRDGASGSFAASTSAGLAKCQKLSSDDDESLGIEVGPPFELAKLAQAAPHLILSESREMITAKDEAQRECQHEQEHEHQGLINMESQKAFDSENDDDFDDIPEPELMYQLLSKQSVGSDDYFLCRKHEVGDFDLIPGNLQKEIRDFAETKFIPAVFKYLGEIFPKYLKYSVFQVELDGFDLPSYEDGITSELAYDLTKTEDLLQWPRNYNIKIKGKRAIGSVIRICKAINRQELANDIYQIVKNCFTPNEHQDPKDSERAEFGLYVEPSTGGIQCNCCKGVYTSLYNFL